MEKDQQQNEQDGFTVENSAELDVELGTDTTVTADGEEPQPEGAVVESTFDTGDDQGQKKEETAPKGEEQKPKPTRRQRRNQKQQNDNKALREENERLKKELSGSDSKSNADDINIDDYETYDEYLEALGNAEEKGSKKETKEETPYDQEDLSMVIQDGAEAYDDFEELTRDPKLALTEAVLADVLESEQATDVIYHLAQNQEKTLEIAQMTPRARLKALAKIELELETKPNVVKKKVSSAPDPITPVNGNSSRPASLDDDNLSYEDHEKILNSQQTSTNGWA